jgi:soluble lytic murein transglycosylase-like protein
MESRRRIAGFLGALAVLAACGGPQLAPAPALAPPPVVMPSPPAPVPPIAPAVAPLAAEPLAAPLPPAVRPRDPCDPDPSDRRVALRPEGPARPIRCDQAVELARAVAADHGLEAGLILGVMRVESGFVANAISPATAVGLMQVMPASGGAIGCGDLFDPGVNADCGARILKAFLAFYKGNVTLALSGYNAGHGMPDNARRETRIPKNFQYVEDVLRARARWLRHGCAEWDRPVE